MWYSNVLKAAINVILSITELFLGLRLLLKVFAAKAAAPFVGWIYETSEPLLYPFQGMFPSPSLEGGFVIEFSTLFAMVAYALLAWILIELIIFIGGLSQRRENKEEK